jgi:hypothetical protein
MAWVTFLVLIIVWVMKVEGGMGFVATNVFGWHAVLMSAAFGKECVQAYVVVT